MRKRIKWGILGCARIAEEKFIPAMIESCNSEFYAIASTSSQRIEKFKEKFQFQKTYNLYEDLLEDNDIQAVYIPLPNALHKEWVIRAAEKGKHVLCEKPISLNSSECIEMMTECKKNNVKLMEAFMFRYTNRIKKVMEIIENGVIGDVKHISSTFGFYLTQRNDYRMDPELGGGSIYDVGSYAINFCSMITQDFPESITVDFIKKNGVDIAASVILKYKSGVLCTLNSWFNAYNRTNSEITGTKGYIEIPNTYSGDCPKITVVTADEEKEVDLEHNNGYKAEIEDFADAIINDRPPVLSLDETCRNMKIIEKVLYIMGRQQQL